MKKRKQINSQKNSVEGNLNDMLAKRINFSVKSNPVKSTTTNFFKYLCLIKNRI